MNEFLKTGAFVAVAVGLGVFAYVTLPGGVEHELFDDQGELFFEEFETTDQAAAIEVYEFGINTEPFAVARDGDRWTIPSHNDYPADASDQMADAATLLIGLEKARVLSDDKQQHKEFGVLDPLEDTGEDEGYGQRVVFKDDGGKVLADLIIGDELADSPGTRYVRLPDQRRVYAAAIEKPVPTDFAKWIEQDVLKTNQGDIAKVHWDNYSIDEQRGVIVPGPNFSVSRGDGGDWNLADHGEGADEPAAPAPVDSSKIQSVNSAIADLSIVGVRAKPEGLNARLEVAEGREKQALLGALAQDLRRKGFYLVEEDRLLSNEGELRVHTSKGVLYTLRFGEVVFGSGKRISAGVGESEPEAGSESEVEDRRPNRYLMVSVALDEDALTPPEGSALDEGELAKRRLARSELEEIRRAIQTHKDQNDGALPESLQALTEGDEPLLEELNDDPWGTPYVFAKTDDGNGFALRSLGADQAEGGEGKDADVDLEMLSRENDFQKFAGEMKAYQQKKKTAEEEVERLTRRFGPWYYVIDASSYDKLKPKREELLKVEGADEAEDESPFGPGVERIGFPDSGGKD